MVMADKGMIKGPVYDGQVTGPGKQGGASAGREEMERNLWGIDYIGTNSRGFTNNNHH
jgi:hypothetical protein